MSAISCFRSIENKHEMYRGRNHMKMQKKIICEKEFENKYLRDKKYLKVGNQCHYTSEYRGAILDSYSLS